MRCSFPLLRPFCCWWLGEKEKAEPVTKWGLLTVSKPSNLLHAPSFSANGVVVFFPRHGQSGLGLRDL